MISITAAAAAHLRSLLPVPDGLSPDRSSAPVSGTQTGATTEGTETIHLSRMGLRILVEKGGCAGMQYAMKLDELRDGDEISEAEGARVFVDPASAVLLRGSQLDYCDDLVGTGFRLLNPNASRSCGCGTSFEPAAAESEQSLHSEQSAPSFAS